MNSLAISLSGLRTAEAQFNASAAEVQRAVTPTAPAADQPVRNIEPITLSGGDLAAGLVGQMMALTSYRANIRALNSALEMQKTAVDLIG